MFHFCAICMVKRSLVELTCERRRFLEVLVSPFINLDTLKKCRVLICLNCSRLLSTMLRFQQTVLKGLLNLVALHTRTRTNYVCHNLPAVIHDESDMLLPVVGEEVIASSEFSLDPSVYYVHRKLKKGNNLKPTDSLYDEEKFLLETRNTKEPWEVALEILESQPSKTVPIDVNWKPSKPTKPRPDGSVSSTGTLSCESDFDNPQSVPGYNQVVSTSEAYDHGYIDKDDMAVLVPVKATIDNREPINTKESHKVEKTKLNSQLYKAIQLALKSNSISDDFDITRYQPESESGLESPHEMDSESRLESPHEIESTDSESTLSCHSDYEDAETFPNVVFANAFNDVSEDSEDEQNNKLHVVTDPPSEWPCTFEPCSLKHNLYDGDDNYSDDFEEDTYLGSRSRKTIGRRSRKKCNLCNKFFPNVYSLWVHYERDHVDVCNRECCNEKDTNREKTNTKQLKILCGVQRENPVQNGVQEIAEKEVQPWKGCAECGVRVFRRNLHYTSLRHRVTTQWRFQCDICKRKLKDKALLALHIEKQHSEKGALKCPMCPTTFRSSRALHKHAAAHILADKNTDAATNAADKTTRKIDSRKTNTIDSSKTTRTVDSRKTNTNTDPAPNTVDKTTTRKTDLRKTNTNTIDAPQTTRTVADLRKALKNRTRTAQKTLKRKRAVVKSRKTVKKRARTSLQTTQNRGRVNTRDTEVKLRTEGNARKKTKDVVKSWAEMQDKSNTGLRQYGNKRFQVGNFRNIQHGFERTDNNTRETIQGYSQPHDRVQDYNSIWRLNPYGYKQMNNVSETQDSNKRTQSQDGLEKMQDNTPETQYSGNTRRLKPYGQKRMRLMDRLESVFDSNTRSQSQDGLEHTQDNTLETQNSGNTRMLKPYGYKRMRLMDRLESVLDSNTRSQSEDGLEHTQDNTLETQYSGNTRRLQPYGKKRMRLMDRLESVLDSNTRSQSEDGLEHTQDNTFETQYSDNTRRLKPYAYKRMQVNNVSETQDSNTRSKSQDGFERMQDNTHETQYSGNTRRLKPFRKKRMRLMDRLESVLDSNTRSQSEDGMDHTQDNTLETQYSDNTRRLKPYGYKRKQVSNVSETHDSNTRSKSQDGFERMQDNNHEAQYSGNTQRLKQYENKRKKSNVSESVQERAIYNTRETLQDFGSTRETTQHGNTRMKLYDNVRIQASNVRSLIKYAFERTQDSNTETSTNTQFKQYGNTQEQDSNTCETQDNTRQIRDTHMRRRAGKPRWRPKTVRALRRQTESARRANKKENSVGPRGNDSWMQIAGVPAPSTPS